MPAAPERKPAFERIAGEAPDSQHTGPADKPTFIWKDPDGTKGSVIPGRAANVARGALTFRYGT